MSASGKVGELRRRSAGDALYGTVKAALDRACAGRNCDAIGIDVANEMDLHLALAGALEIYKSSLSRASEE